MQHFGPTLVQCPCCKFHFPIYMGVPLAAAAGAAGDAAAAAGAQAGDAAAGIGIRTVD